MIQRVQQEDPMGCGVACLAMILGQSYEQTFSELSETDRQRVRAERGMSDYGMIWVLNVRGIYHRRSWPEAPPASGVAICLTKDAHWIVSVDGMVLDPARSQPLERYPISQVIEVLPP